MAKAPTRATTKARATAPTAALRSGARSLVRALAVVLVLASTGALAAERQVTLAVDNMNCPSCPYIVNKVLSDVPGVRKVSVLYRMKQAKVVYDDALTDVATLTAATGGVGYPSRVIAPDQ